MQCNEQDFYLRNLFSVVGNKERIIDDRRMKSDKEVRICDLCKSYYAVFDNPDYEFIYLTKKLDVCHNCYNKITNAIQTCKAGVPRNVEYVD